jgi:hypothetical protein
MVTPVVRSYLKDAKSPLPPEKISGSSTGGRGFRGGGKMD